MLDAVPLGQLLRQAARAVQVGVPDAVWVVAAVAAVKVARGGHSVELVEPEVARAEAGGLRAYLPDGVIEALGRSAGQAVSATDLIGMTIVVRLALELHPRWGLSGRMLALGPGINDSLAKRAVEASVARLKREGLFDRQRSLSPPCDVTLLAVVHPPAAAGWADVAAELARWAGAGLIVVRSVPVAFEGPGAATGIAAAVARAVTGAGGAAGGGSRPDLVLLVRGGGAAASLGALDDEKLARTIATTSVPVLTGLGHAVNCTIADRVAWRSVDTPSKALALVRETMVAPARRAQTDHAAVLAAVSAAVDRAEPRLSALERIAAAEALRHLVSASQGLDRVWGTVREAAEAARGRLARIDDHLGRTAADVVRASPILVGRTKAELEALMAAIRVRARRASEGADDGARHLATAAERAASLLNTAAVELATLAAGADAAAAIHLDRTGAGLDVLARTVREQGHRHVAGADDGATVLAAVEAVVCERLRAEHVANARLRETIESAVERRLDAAATALDRALGTLDAVDPVGVLARGYTLVTDVDGRVLTSAAVARAAAAPLVLHFSDGTIAVRLNPSQPSIGDRS